MNAQPINIIVSSMTPEDVAEVLEIQNETNLSRWKDADYLREIENKDSINIAAKFENNVVGFAVVHLLAGLSENSYDSAEIYNIAVGKLFQNKSIGQKLFDKIMSVLLKKNAAEIWLEVRQSNRKAINFYGKNGFVKQFTRKNYYNNPTENADVLMKTLRV